MIHDAICGGQHDVTKLWEGVIHIKSVNIHPGSNHIHQKRKLTPRAGSKLFTHFSTSLSGQSYLGDMTPHLFMRPKSYTKQKIKKKHCYLNDKTSDVRRTQRRFVPL